MKQRTRTKITQIHFSCRCSGWVLCSRSLSTISPYTLSLSLFVTVADVRFFSRHICIVYLYCHKYSPFKSTPRRRKLSPFIRLCVEYIKLLLPAPAHARFITGAEINESADRWPPPPEKKVNNTILYLLPPQVYDKCFIYTPYTVTSQSYAIKVLLLLTLFYTSFESLSVSSISHEQIEFVLILL